MRKLIETTEITTNENGTWNISFILKSDDGLEYRASALVTAGMDHKLFVKVQEEARIKLTKRRVWLNQRRALDKEEIEKLSFTFEE